MTTPVAPYTLPAPAGPIRQLADENTYCGFPVTIRSSAGTGLVAYAGGGPGHVPNVRLFRVRRLPPGAARWSAPITIAASGGSGLATEDAAAGGRVFAAVANGISWSDDDGLTWSPIVALPGQVPGHLVTGGPTWSDGTLYVPTYEWASATDSTNLIRVYASTDRGLSWSLRGSVTIAGRPAYAPGKGPAQEPVMVVLADGRLGVLIRSDGAENPDATAYNYFLDAIYLSTSTDKGYTWSYCSGQQGSPGFAGWRIPYATGQPNAVVLADGRILVVFRGVSEKTGRTAYSKMPVRVALLAPDGSNYVAADGTNPELWQQLDLVDGDQRFMVYGSWLPGWQGSCDRLIWAAHNTYTSTGVADLASPWATATLYERLMTWEEVP